MLTIRDYRAADESAVKQLHQAQGFSYVLPPLTDTNFMVRAVLEGHSGEIKMAMLLRSTAEAYLLLDPREGTRKEKIGMILALQKEVVKAAKVIGIADIHAWLPPEIPSFGKLMLKNGWKKPEWVSYFREVQ